ncbi:hypothetical protein [Sorangium sp. So ce693]|uniref:hypothetical protein n=1 Tax=Sorangium sp. So ce693 TaxID=3133318 RepID=UPI003F6034BF
MRIEILDGWNEGNKNTAGLKKREVEWIVQTALENTSFGTKKTVVKVSAGGHTSPSDPVMHITATITGDMDVEVHIHIHDPLGFWEYDWANGTTGVNPCFEQPVTLTY